MARDSVHASVEESVVRLAKHKCIETDLSMSEVVEALLSFWLGRPARTVEEEQILADVAETIEMQKRVRKGV